MHTDPIADMLTRIRNAQMVKKSEVILPYSKLKLNILNLLSKEGWIGKVEKVGSVGSRAKAKKKDNLNKFDTIKLELKYVSNEPKISSIQRVSKPGRRVYVSKDEMPIVLNGLGIAIISTSLGLLTNIEAKQKKVGGEIICEIY